MSLTALIVLLVVLGVVWWLLTAVIPVPEQGKKIINVVFVVLFVLIAVGVLVGVLGAFGLGDIRIGTPLRG